MLNKANYSTITGHFMYSSFDYYPSIILVRCLDGKTAAAPGDYFYKFLQKFGSKQLSTKHHAVVHVPECQYVFKDAA